MGRGHSPWVHHLVSRALPNMPLEAGGRSQVGRNCVASLASLFVCRSTALRRRTLRPQLKRGPLGGREIIPETVSPTKRGAARNDKVLAATPVPRGRLCSARLPVHERGR